MQCKIILHEQTKSKGSFKHGPDPISFLCAERKIPVARLNLPVDFDNFAHIVPGNRSIVPGRKDKRFARMEGSGNGASPLENGLELFSARFVKGRPDGLKFIQIPVRQSVRKLVHELSYCVSVCVPCWNDGWRIPKPCCCRRHGLINRASARRDAGRCWPTRIQAGGGRLPW